MPYPKNKYRKGWTIDSFDRLYYDHLEAGRWVYLRDKVVHPSVILNMTIKTVIGFMHAFLIREAIDQKKKYYKKVIEKKTDATLSN